MNKKCKIMNEVDVNNKLNRLALEIIEFHKTVENLYLVGIRSRGVPMVERIANFLKTKMEMEIQTGILDISFYRDDLSLVAEKPILNNSQLDFCIDNAKIVLIDDVLYSGKTVQKAIEVLHSLGKPKNIQLCVLIDRGHHKTPINADFVGNYVPTAPNEIIKVSLKEIDEDDAVLIMI
ncbi:MAG: bifunctional pyr operon transcriptional regulator/uracil phosphoribosyltransferase PyrR [Candidatus Cloacimonetes bacterium]|jgi:pyrimidine operon attenuation protein / uracil phosphoribosyltransferase|nr:bifunctional pyr operon transcriptional regulator/uracil phosphoribosyltransferase PyrR [Candidatus Cloacimonadota bacterium]MBT6993656.1 bifunctional pyr operon transcriptional regulator/uracil phosphoribosyltransferase PyrR [Candidatus Cloacimonadota bacterium]MBT7470009.1 bifunctional pyr operon transcriptional regulator/uracil phosphoribosyltransferase PyrR [Candidatus Cloacimonadota bacterium]